MIKALITGSNGFVGRHLMNELRESGYEVFGTTRFGRNKMNILNYEEVRSMIRSVKPDVIFHLAAIAFVPSSWQDPELTFNVNTIGSMNLFNAVRSVGIDPVIQIAGSSEEYGLVHEDEVPMDEDQPLRPLSPYAVSKIAMDYLGYQYNKTYGLKIIRTRAFNHEGYGRGEVYMPSTFAKQVADIEAGKQKPVIKHGNLESKRDITDVRDMVRAYRMATEKCIPGEVYNIGSGKVYTAQQVLDTLVSMSEIDISFELDPKRLRPSDVKILESNSTKFRNQTGWEPTHKIEDTLSETLRYWRERA